jgi:TetR/AcrR family transcriptional regulator, lmrAB and yxaGH operons repressor
VKKSNSREKLIETTAALLQKQGYFGTGLNEIVKESGAPKGSLYFHFPGGKEELAAEALALNGAGMRASLQAALEGVADLEQALGVAIDALAMQLEASAFEDGCPIATVALEAAATSDRIHEVVKEAYESWEGIIEARLIGGGVKPAEAKQMSVAILAAVEGGLLLARAYRNTAPLRAVQQLLVRMVKK